MKQQASEIIVTQTASPVVVKIVPAHNLGLE